MPSATEVLPPTAMVPEATKTSLVNLVAIKPVGEIKSPPGVVVIDSIDQLSEKTRMWLKACPLSGFEDKKSALLEISKETSEKKPITKRLLFQMLHEEDINMDLSKANKRIDRLILAANKETRKGGFVIKSASMVIGDKEELVCWKAKTEKADGSRDKIKEKEVASTLELLHTASPVNFATYRSLTIGVFGDVTEEHIKRMQTTIMPQVKIELNKLGEVLIKKHLNRSSKEFAYSKFGFWIVKKDKASGTIPAAPPVKTAPFVPYDTLTSKKTDGKIEIYPSTTVNPQGEKWVGGKYHLPDKVRNDLARVLKEWRSVMVLGDFGITLEKKQSLAASEVIRCYCGGIIGEFESSTNIKDVFKLLRDSLKDLVGGHRKEFKDQNMSLIEPILKIFDNVTSENLDLLMVKLCNVHLAKPISLEEFNKSTTVSQDGNPSISSGQEGESEVEDLGPEKSVDYQEN